jgi:hypothetical protein
MLCERAVSIEAFGMNIIIQQFRREVVMITEVVRILPEERALVQIVAGAVEPVRILLEPPLLGKTPATHHMHATNLPAVLLQYLTERAMAHMLVPS